MRQISKIGIFILSLFFANTMLFASDSTTLSPLGYWKTIDDVTQKPKAIVELYQSQDKQLYGKILKIYPRPGHTQNEVCVACEGDKHNQRIVGMVFLEHLKKSSENLAQWEKGRILDPKNGKEYHCSLSVADNGNKLNVRGYIGIPLFGRSQTWVKVDDLKQA